MSAVHTTAKKRTWARRILTGIATLALFGSAVFKIAGVPQVVEGLTRIGKSAEAILPITMLELTCVPLVKGHGVRREQASQIQQFRSLRSRQKPGAQTH